MNLAQLSAMSTDDLRALNHNVVWVINSRRAERQQEAARSLRVGEKRSFFSSKYGRDVEVTITRINRVSVSAMEDNGRQWKVAPSHFK